MPTQTAEKSINIPISTIREKEYKKLCERNDFSLEEEQLLERAKNDFQKGKLSSRKKIMEYLNS